MKTVNSFNFQPKDKLLEKYSVVRKIGSGWEGEVYLIKEKKTGIERAAKFFFPRRNRNNETLKFHAKKLNKLRDCTSIIKYFTQETIAIDENEITFLVSEYVQGENLAAFVKRQKNKRIDPYQGLHLLYAMAKAINEVHIKKEYHGDLHTDNIMIEKHGVNFKLKIFDMFHYGKPNIDKCQQDIVDVIRIFYEIIGGPKTYPLAPNYVKQICMGNKSNLIRKKFKTAQDLINFLEALSIE